MTRPASPACLTRPASPVIMHGRTKERAHAG